METQSVEEEDQKSLVKKEFHMKPATASRLTNVADGSNDVTPSINTTPEDVQPVSKEPRWPKIRGRVDFLNFECNLAFHYSFYI